MNAKDGKPVDSFGDHGMVDLKVGAYTGVMGQPGVYKQIDLTTGEIGLHSTPTVAGNIVFVGSSFKEGSQPLEQNNTKGITRAFDAAPASCSGPSTTSRKRASPVTNPG